MNHWLFLFRLKQKRVMQAIAEAEARTSGEIRVYVTHRKCADAFEEARKKFQSLGMTGTKHRNGVLIFIAPRSTNFAVIGDKGVHDKCGETFWREVADAMSAELRAGRLTEALVHAVETTAALLAQHFPPDSGTGNELPDQIQTD